MTTTEPIHEAVPVRLDFDEHAPVFSKAMSHLDHAAAKQLDAAGIEPKLRELVRARVSQLNGCAYCVDMHSKDARALGETDQRLYALPVWRDTGFYDARERAALAFAEAVTLTARAPVSDADYAALAAQFSPTEVGALVALIVTINAWNAIGVSTHAWEPGSYEV
jgi:AhpD family alkylhydroperoxidase